MKNTKYLAIAFTLCCFVGLLSGCATSLYTSSNHLTSNKSDQFTPTALFRSKSDDGFAVEGKLVKANGKGASISYIVIPKKVLIAAHMQTKGDITFRDIQSLSVQQKEGIYLRSKIGSDYERVASLSEPGTINVNNRTTLNVSNFGMLPFTFAIDAVTFPLQAIVLTAMQTRGGFHGPE
jgi:hypothetical protein